METQASNTITTIITIGFHQIKMRRAGSHQMLLVRQSTTTHNQLCEVEVEVPDQQEFRGMLSSSWVKADTNLNARQQMGSSIRYSFTPTTTTTVRVLAAERVQSFDRPCAPLRLQSREMQPRGGARIFSIVQHYTFKHIDGEIWGTNPRPNMYVVYVITNELKLGFGSSCLNQR